MKEKAIKHDPKYQNGFLYLIELAVLACLMFVKGVFFYRGITLGNYGFVNALFTCGISALILLALWLPTRLDPSKIFLAIYTVASVLMTVDTLYFAYYSRLPSVALVKIIPLLAGVTDSVENLMTFGRMMFVLDVPIIILYFIFVRKYLRAPTRVTEDKRRRISIVAKSVVAALTALSFLSYPAATLASNITPTVLKKELFVYHAKDIFDTVFSKSRLDGTNPGDLVQSDPEASRFNGIAKDRNLIVIQVEALQGAVIGAKVGGQEITPFLNSLIRGETLYFDNYYYLVGGGNTSDAEFTVNNSLYSPETTPSYIEYAQNLFHGLPYLVKDYGYSGSHAFHGYTKSYWNRENAYKTQGFDDFTGMEDLDRSDIVGMGISDMSFFSQALDIMMTYEEPFYSFMVTLSTHHPYNIPLSLRELDLPPEYESTLLGDYFQAVNYADRALQSFFEGLKEKGLYENSMIVIYGDHYGIMPSSDEIGLICDFVGHGFFENDQFKIPLIINVPGSGIGETISVTGSHLDLLPTMLDLLGMKNEHSVMFGQNLLTATEGIVYQQMHVPIGSFVDDDVFLVYPMSGLASDIAVFDKKTGQRISSQGYDDKINAAIKAHEECKKILDNNAVVVK